jgi:sugar diacid utilization regulator
MEALRTMFVGMLSGVEPDQHNVARTLKLVNWYIKDNYRLVTISIPEIRNDISKIFYYLYEYENTFPDCVGFIFLDNILLLIHNDTEARMAECTPKLEKLLMTHDAVCGISVPFCSIAQINAQYLNARLAIQLGNKDDRIRVLNDYLDEHFVRLIAGATSIIPLCHRAVIQLMEYDKENGTEFLTSLEVYLRQNRSLKAAATELFIHRNTLTYRLRCIENIVTMNLENSHERLHVLLSCIVLRIMGMT